MKKKNVPMAGGIFLTALTLVLELLLHFWIGGSFAPAQLIPLVFFALFVGSALSVVVCLLPPVLEKWISVVLSLLLVTAFMTEYCLNESFTSFMPPRMIFNGAGGVANGFMDVIVTLIKANILKILLVLLPSVLFALFIQPVKGSLKRSLLFVFAAAVACGAACGSLYGFAGDLHAVTDRFDFDSSVRTHGLAISTILEVTDLGSEEENFVVEEIPVVTVPVAETKQEEEIPEETVPRTPHVMDLDFASLAKNGPIGKLNSYVQSQTPSMTNDYTGMFAGKNLILITAEAFTAEVIDPDLTPALYRMATKGIQFTDFYQPGWNGGTTGGELANLSSLVPQPSSGMGIFSNQKPFITIGHKLQELGYFSRAYHNNTGSFYDRYKTHPNLGYDKFIAMFSGMEGGVKNVWPQSDLEMMEFTVPQYIDQQPFSIYYMSVSGHSVYTLDGNAQARKNYDRVKDLPYSEPVKCYLAANLEFEYAMESLLRQLETAGIADDTVVVISPDHYPYGLDAGSAWGHNKNYVAELFGIAEKDMNNMFRDHSAAIIWSGCLEDKNIVVGTPTYSLDILPTLCNLFGVEYDSRLLVGRDVFSDTMPLVLWANHSWITESGRYNSETGVFTPNPGADIPEGYVKSVSAVVQNKINYSHAALSNYYFTYLQKEINKQAKAQK